MDLRLRDVQAQRAVEPVPPREDRAEIRVVLALDLRVVNAVHARRDQHFAQKPFEADWEPQVAVVKKHLQLKGQLVNCKGPRRNADKTYLDHAKDARKGNLAKMKSDSRRDVQFWVDMMNVMKAPEKRRAVVGEMPVVEGQVHQQKTSGQFKPRWKSEKVDKTKGPVSGPT